MKIGVLAVQGNYSMHSQVLNEIGFEAIMIRYPAELDLVEGLVIPGGESTTMSKLMNRVGFYNPIKEFANDYPIMGTCAGLILMSDYIIDSDIETLKLLTVNVKRNGYGRQIHSNTEQIDFNLNNSNYTVPASFIRAPKITSYDESISVIATFEESPVVVKNGKHIGISFHPELDNISIFHEHIFNSYGTNKQ